MRHLIWILVLAACDSPGGQGSPCLVDPTAPQCGADVVAGDVGGSDVALPDVGLGDAAPADAVLRDVGLGDTAAISDVARGDTGNPIECVAGLSRCDGNLIEECIDGHWLATRQCMGNDLCINGACVTQECLGSGERCVEGAVERCVDNHWRELERCEFGCDGDACATHGDADCVALLECGLEKNCAFANDACVAECARRGDPAAAETFESVYACWDDASYTTLLEDCTPLEARCLAPTAGTGDCATLNACVEDCGATAYACRAACFAAATRDAGEYRLRWEVCDGCFSNFFACDACVLYLGSCP